MKINDALTKSMKDGKLVYRKSEFDNDLSEGKLVHTSDFKCCLIVPNRKSLGNFWSPTAEDLMANDWQVKW